MNGIYLHLWLREVKEMIVNRFINDITQQDRVVQIVLGDRALFVSLYPEAPAVYLSKPVKHSFGPVPLPVNELRACKIIDIQQPAFMPRLIVELEKKLTDDINPMLIISLYREAPNFSIKTVIQKNLFKRFVEKEPRKSIFELTEEDLALFAHEKDPETYREHLLKNIEGIDKNLGRELTLVNLRIFKDILLQEQIKPRLCSVKPLRISLFAAKYIKEYPSFNSLLEDATKQFLLTKNETMVQRHRTILVRDLKKRRARLEKKLTSSAAIEEYRIIGEMILANMAKIKKGVKVVSLLNPYTHKGMAITLDPTQTPQQNAQHYFQRYKKLKRGNPQLHAKIKDLTKEIENIETAELPSEALPPHRPAALIRQAKIQPFRTFPLPSGSEVYVGKDAKSNIDLTFRFARPNDYFFHVRGFGGAHTILKAKVPKGQKPRKDDIEAAAAIAAYFSKAKNQNKATVSYTQRKYLKKSKKGKPGLVILMREETLFVKPGLPVQT